MLREDHGKRLSEAEPESFMTVPARGPIFDLLRFNGERLQRFVITNPSYPNPFAATGAALPPTSVVRLDPNGRIPYTFQHSVSVERQLQRATTLTVSYFRTSGILFRSRDLNAPLPPFYSARQ